MKIRSCISRLALALTLGLLCSCQKSEADYDTRDCYGRNSDPGVCPCGSGQTRRD